MPGVFRRPFDHALRVRPRALATLSKSVTATLPVLSAPTLIWVSGNTYKPQVVATYDWTPAALFASSEEGGWYEPGPTTCYTDDGTTAAGENDLVYRMDDLSGNDNHLYQTNESLRPALRKSGDLWYLEFDGSDDFMATASAIDFSGGSVMTMGAAATKQVSAVQLSVAVGTALSNRVLMSVQSGSSTPNRTTGYYHNATGVVATPEDAADEKTTVAVGRGRVSGTYETSLWRNDDDVVTSASNQSATLPNSAIYLGRNYSAANYLDGYIYGAVLVADYCSNEEVESLKGWLASKVGGMPT